MRPKLIKPRRRRGEEDKVRGGELGSSTSKQAAHRSHHPRPRPVRSCGGRTATAETAGPARRESAAGSISIFLHLSPAKPASLAPSSSSWNIAAWTDAGGTHHGEQEQTTTKFNACAPKLSLHFSHSLIPLVTVRVESGTAARHMMMVRPI